MSTIAVASLFRGGCRPQGLGRSSGQNNPEIILAVLASCQSQAQLPSLKRGRWKGSLRYKVRITYGMAFRIILTGDGPNIQCNAAMEKIPGHNAVIASVPGQRFWDTFFCNFPSADRPQTRRSWVDHAEITKE